MKRYFLFLCLILFLLCGCSDANLPQASAPDVSPEPAPSSAAPDMESVLAPASVPTPSPAPSYPPDELNAADGQYTIAWMTDTQYYSRSFPQTYHNMTRFLLKNKERLNLQYVAHTGDLVNNAKDEKQWKAANAAMNAISEIPGGVLAGNHDIIGRDNFSAYTKYFGEDRYSSAPWYGGSYENNRGHYDLLNAGSTNYLFVYMSYAPDEDAIAWLNEVFAAYPDRLGVLLLHDYLDSNSELSADGELLFEKVVKPNSNIRFVLCGHRYRLNNLDAELDDDGDGRPDRTVHQIIGNYQAAGDMGGSGFMRFFKVDEKADRIYMYSYSPHLDEYVYYDTPERQKEKYATPPERETLIFDVDFPDAA